MSNKEVQGYCVYCKNEIYADSDYVVRYNNKYHVECYDLIESDSFGEDLADFTETDGE